MAARRFNIDGVGDVALHKRKGARTVRLSIAHDGTIRLTMPLWMPYQTGLAFVAQKQEWIAANRYSVQPLKSGLRVGKAHTLVYLSGNGQKPTTRVLNGQVTVHIPTGMGYMSEPVQKAAKSAAIRALKTEAESLLPQRLATLAKQNGFIYTDVQIKKLKSRWGSCNHRKEIVLNCFLMQLPWQLIDYVLLHELIHTRILAHGPAFWDELGKYVEDLPSVRRVMRTQKPHLRTE